MFTWSKLIKKDAGAWPVTKRRSVPDKYFVKIGLGQQAVLIVLSLDSVSLLPCSVIFHVSSFSQRTLIFKVVTHGNRKMVSIESKTYF